MLAEVVAYPPVVGLEGYLEGVLDAMGCAPTLELTFGGDKKKLLNLFSVIEEDRYCVEGVSISNSKGKRQLKNLECFINFEASGCGSNRVKGKVV
jgi:hypothetical protein